MLVMLVIVVATVFVPQKLQHVQTSTHNAEQPVKIVALFFRIHSVTQRGHDLTGWSWTPSAALAALTLQLGVASQDHPLELV